MDTVTGREIAEVGTCETCHDPVDLANEQAVAHHTLRTNDAACDACWHCWDKPRCYRCFNADCECSNH